MSLMTYTPAGLQLLAIKVLATLGVLALVFFGGYCTGSNIQKGKVDKENVKIEAVRADNAVDAGRTLADVVVAGARTEASFKEADKAIDALYPDPPKTAKSTSRTAPATVQPIPLPEMCREAITVYGCSCGPVLDPVELRLFNWGNRASEVERPFDTSGAARQK